MQPLADLIRQAHIVSLVSHLNPDGDAIGSLLGLQLGLEQLGKTVQSSLASGVPDIFGFLKDVHTKISTTFFEECDLCLILDTNDLVRTGYTPVIKSLIKKKKVGLIDHHPKGDLIRVVSGALHNEKAGSTAELVYTLLQTLAVKITPDIATALLTGLYTDTGGFQHPNTDSKTLEIAAELMRRGARLNSIVQHITHNKTVAGLKLLGVALQRLRLTQGGTVAISWLTQQDMLDCVASEEDLSGIMSELNVLPQVHFCLLLTESTSGVIRGTLRTGAAHRTNVYHLAKLLGGGGHPRAAGFSLAGHLRHDSQSDTGIIVAG